MKKSVKIALKVIEYAIYAAGLIAFEYGLYKWWLG